MRLISIPEKFKKMVGNDEYRPLVTYIDNVRDAVKKLNVVIDDKACSDMIQTFALQKWIEPTQMEDGLWYCGVKEMDKACEKYVEMHNSDDEESKLNFYKVSVDMPMLPDNLVSHWIIQDDCSLYHVFRDYLIEGDRLNESDWIEHMMEKMWCNMDEFLVVYFSAKKQYNAKEK